MPKVHLSAAVVSEVTCPNGKAKIDLYDDQVVGFIFERRSSGGGTYYFRFSDNSSKQAQFKIGGEKDISFAAAKKRAVQLRSEVVMGGDPRAKKAEAKSIPQFRELAAMYLADAKLHQRSYSTTEGYMRNHISPRWSKVRLTDIDSRAVAQWLGEKRAEGLAPATVLKIGAIFHRSFEVGAKWGVPGTEKNPMRGVSRKPVLNSREKFLNAEESIRLRDAVAASQNTQLKHIVGLLLLTGARKRELLDARWQHVDVARQSWLIPTSKTGRPRHVPLSSAALAIIADLPRFQDCPWLVPNPATGLPFTDIKNAWSRAIRAAKLPGLRIHDLRHSAASFMCAAGIDLYAVGKVLGHANVASTARYSHLANSTLLAAVEAGAAKQIAV